MRSSEQGGQEGCCYGSDGQAAPQAAVGKKTWAGVGGGCDRRRQRRRLKNSNRAAPLGSLNEFDADPIRRPDVCKPAGVNRSPEPRPTGIRPESNVGR